jgi:multidrug efflux pump subunit AcrA (membrane-fusion protein)
VVTKSEAYRGKIFESVVDVIRPVGDVTTRTYRMDSYLPDDTPLMAGMTVDVNVVLDERDGALLVPSSSLVRQKAQGGQLGSASLWVIEQQKLFLKPVTVGTVGPAMAEIKEGITLDTIIALKAAKDWRDGKAVRAKIKENVNPALSSSSEIK